MRLNLKRTLLIAIAALALVAFAGGAYAASQDHGASERQAFMNDAAKRLGVSPQRLEAALQGALSDRLDAAVAVGKLTKAQADAIKRRIQQNGFPFGGPGPLEPRGLGTPFGPGGPLGLHRERGPRRGLLSAAAKYLGVSDAQLASELDSGRSLAQVARSRGKSVSGLEQAMIAPVKTKLDSAVAAKRLSASQDQQILSRLQRRIADIVNRTPPEAPPGPWAVPPAEGFHDGGDGAPGGGPPPAEGFHDGGDGAPGGGPPPIQGPAGSAGQPSSATPPY